MTLKLASGRMKAQEDDALPCGESWVPFLQGECSPPALQLALGTHGASACPLLPDKSHSMPTVWGEAHAVMAGSEPVPFNSKWSYFELHPRALLAPHKEQDLSWLDKDYIEM